MTTSKSTQKEVSCKAIGWVFVAAQRKGIDEKVILDGVPYDLSLLLNKHERVEWKYVCRIFSNLRPFFTASEFEEMGKEHVRNGSYVEGVLTSFIFFSSSRIARMFREQFFRVGDKDVTCFHHALEYVAPNNVRVTVTLDDSYEFCPEFFLAVKGAWNQFGTIIGHKDFKIELVWIHQGVIFDVSWKKESIAFGLKKWWRYLFNLRTAFADLAESHEELLRQYNRMEASKQLLQRQKLRLETAYGIATSIRRSAEIDGMLGTITQALVNYAGCLSARVAILKDAEGADASIEAFSGSDELAGSPLTRSITNGDQHIGEITIRPNIGQDADEFEELLNYLLPIINIAIHDALGLRAVTEFKNNLETTIDRRTAELQKTQSELANSVHLLQNMQWTQNRFFANISHEFRTPLTLILGPLAEIADQTEDENIRVELRVMEKNANHLLRLVNQLLDLSRFESGNMILQASPQNVIPLFRDCVLSFAQYAEKKKILLEYASLEDEVIACVDKEKMEKIFSNILSNAFKFTPQGGRIEVNVMRNEDHVTVDFTDTGIGVPKELLPNIFDRFYQVEGTRQGFQGGTGIGLDLTKKLVGLHKGTITAESEDGKGTTFTVSIPLGKDHLKPGEVVEHPGERLQVDQWSMDPPGAEGERITDLNMFAEGQRPIVLIVEDNADVRHYIKRNLESEYVILEAVDGEDAWARSLEDMPDLIVSDVMMPKMDGFELCKRLKTDERTSHIPLMLLTARASVEDKVEGFEKGAEQYLMKPFAPEELRARVKGLIQQRKRVHEFLRKRGIRAIEESTITSLDKKFLEKLSSIIAQNISNGSFGVESLAEMVGISRSVLHRKTVSLTGEAPVELIRRTRLTRAAEMIRKKSGNMSEIALEVGFSNPAYFSECFKKQFKVSPSRYLQTPSRQ